jgi:hypothetical protein
MNQNCSNDFEQQIKFKRESKRNATQSADFHILTH